MLINACKYIFVHTYMCVYKVPAAKDPQVFLYGVLKSAILGVLLGEGSGQFLHKKTMAFLVVHSALSSWPCIGDESYCRSLQQHGVASTGLQL